MIANISSQKKNGIHLSIHVIFTCHEKQYYFWALSQSYHMNFAVFTQTTTLITRNHDLSYHTEMFPRTQDFQILGAKIETVTVKLGWLVTFYFEIYSESGDTVHFTWIRGYINYAKRIIELLIIHLIEDRTQ